MKRYLLICPLVIVFVTFLLTGLVFGQFGDSGRSVPSSEDSSLPPLVLSGNLSEETLFKSSELSNMVSGVNISKSLEKFSMRSLVESVTVITFDIEALIASFNFKALIGEIVPIKLFEQNVTAIARRKSGDGRFIYCLFATKESSDPILLTIDQKTENVTGWANFNNGEFIIRPVLNKRGKAVKGKHLLVKLGQGNEAADVSPDYGDVRGTATTTQEGGAPFLAPEEQNRTAPVSKNVGQETLKLSIKKPLVIYVAYTAKSELRANEDKNSRWHSQIHIVEAETVFLQDIFKHVGAEIEVQMSRIEQSNYKEPEEPKQPKQPKEPEVEVLKEIVIDLASSNTVPEFVQFRKRRAELHADIGILVVHRESTGECGFATGVGVDAQMAVAVVNWQCIRNASSFLHEIGHLLGAYHEDEEKGAPPYARAFVFKEGSPFFKEGSKPFVTVMGKRELCGKEKCSRIARFSNPRDLYNDIIIGEEGARDNAKVIIQGLQRAVDFGESLANP